MVRDFLLAVVALVVVLVVFVYYLVVKKVFPKQKPDKPIQPDKPIEPLLIEYVDEGYTAETTKQMHSNFLAAADAALTKWPDRTYQCLADPISEDFLSWFSAGDTHERLTPERVRIARAVLEFSALLENWMRELGPNPLAKLFFVLDEQEDVVKVGDKEIPIPFIIIRIVDKLEMGAEKEGRFVATHRIWEAVVALLREGKTRIPGLRANKDVLILPRVNVNKKS